VAGEGKRALIPGGIILVDPKTRQVLRYDARPDVYDRIVVIVHFAELAEVLEVLVQRIMQLLALVGRLKRLGARADAGSRLARLLHHILDVDPEEMVEIHVPVQVAYNCILEPEGDLAVSEIAVGEVEPRSWWDMSGEDDLRGRGSYTVIRATPGRRGT
jgi:hypothetical protein